MSEQHSSYFGSVPSNLGFGDLAPTIPEDGVRPVSREGGGELSAQGFRTLSVPCALIPLKGDTPEIVNDAWTSTFGDPKDGDGLSSLRAGERVWVDRAELLTIDGDLREVRLDTTVVEHGEHYGLFVAVAPAVQRVDRLGLNHVATVEHDLRQPLQAAQMFVDVLRSRLHDDSSSTMILSQIERAISTSQSMLSGLRDTALLEGGHVDVSVRAFDVSEILHDIHSECRPLADQKKIRFRLFDANGLWTISDPLLLRRIIQNLVSNAIKFTERGGVLIGARRRNGYIRLEVWDTGSGVAPDHQGEIFDEFYQADKEHDRERGLGLGLAIVRRISELLGHTLEFRSVPDRGSVFCVSIPDAGEAARPILEDRNTATR